MKPIAETETERGDSDAAVQVKLHLEPGAFLGPRLTVRFDGRQVATATHREGFVIELDTTAGAHTIAVEPPAWMRTSSKIMTLGISNYEVAVGFPSGGSYLVVLQWARYSGSLKLKQIQPL